MENPRIAWLLTSAFYYWHPMLAALTRRFGDLKAYAANWRGYAAGFENSFAVEIVGRRKVIPILKGSTGYGINFTYLPLNIVSRLLEFKPDVIFSNSFGIWTILALAFKPIARWRVVIAYEGSSPSVDCRNSPLRLAMRRSMVKTADACITNSQAGRIYLTEVLKAPEDRVFVHPYEVPAIASFTQVTAQHSIPEKIKPIFLFVGSLISRKGIDLLLDACAILAERGIDRYTLQIVGDGSDRPGLEQFCQEKQLTDRVEWIGRVDYSELGAYFQQADVFVFPTLEDTWGVVVTEAMLLGKPVLCSQWAGASELIEHGENGWIGDPRDRQTLADLLGQIIENPQQAARMGDRARQTMQRYTPEAAADFLADVVERVNAAY